MYFFMRRDINKPPIQYKTQNLNRFMKEQKISVWELINKGKFVYSQDYIKSRFINKDVMDKLIRALQSLRPDLTHSDILSAIDPSYNDRQKKGIGRFRDDLYVLCHSLESLQICKLIAYFKECRKLGAPICWFGILYTLLSAENKKDITEYIESKRVPLSMNDRRKIDDFIKENLDTIHRDASRHKIDEKSRKILKQMEEQPIFCGQTEPKEKLWARLLKCVNKDMKNSEEAIDKIIDKLEDELKRDVEGFDCSDYKDADDVVDEYLLPFVFMSMDYANSPDVWNKIITFLNLSPLDSSDDVESDEQYIVLKKMVNLLEKQDNLQENEFGLFIDAQIYLDGYLVEYGGNHTVRISQPPKQMGGARKALQQYRLEENLEDDE